MGKIIYIGINKLETSDKRIVKTLVLRHMEHLDRVSSNSELKFHVKVHKLEGRMKYVFNTQLNIEKEIFSASSSGWDLRKTIHRIMKKLINAVEHKFHIEGQKQQQFHPKKAKRGFGKSIKLKIKGLVKFW